MKTISEVFIRPDCRIEPGAPAVLTLRVVNDDDLSRVVLFLPEDRVAAATKLDELEEAVGVLRRQLLARGLEAI